MGDTSYSYDQVFIPQPGLPEGVLTFSIKECLRAPRPSGSPNMAGRFPRPIWAGSPISGLVPPHLKSKIQIPNSKKWNFGFWIFFFIFLYFQFWICGFWILDLGF